MHCKTLMPDVAQVPVVQGQANSLKACFSRDKTCSDQKTTSKILRCEGNRELGEKGKTKNLL